MSVMPVDSAAVPNAPAEASFDAAVQNAQEANSSEDQARLDEAMLTGVVALAQTILMPRMNEMLSEAQSDE